LIHQYNLIRDAGPRILENFLSQHSEDIRANKSNISNILLQVTENPTSERLAVIEKYFHLEFIEAMAPFPSRWPLAIASIQRLPREKFVDLDVEKLIPSLIKSITTNHLDIFRAFVDSLPLNLQQVWQLYIEAHQSGRDYFTAYLKSRYPEHLKTQARL
jgi:hypothetical protein